MIGGANLKIKSGDAETMECEAILLGVIVAIEKGWTQVEIESDSEVVINQLKDRGHHWKIETTYSNIITLSDNFSLIEWKLVRRSTNESANWLTFFCPICISFDGI